LAGIPNLGNAILTLGGYYQWMKEDALIMVGPGDVPGTARSDRHHLHLDSVFK
jgi:hypothetical protein